MLKLCVLALAWMVEPKTFESTNSELAPPLATCVRPAVMVIEARTSCAQSPASESDSRQVKKWLIRWENGARELPVRSRSEREEFQQRIHETFNEHTLAAAELLVGHVKAKRLNESFEWRIVEKTRREICLEAIPRDEIERLFYGSLRVSLDTETGVPNQLIIIGRNPMARTVWQPNRRWNPNQIELVHFENDVPPAPLTLVRTADARLD
jgi:hypothetical protein